MAPQGTNDDRGSNEPEGHVKRPMNSYMLFRQARAPGIRAENPKFKNQDVSKEAGREWSKMSKVEKEAWKAKAEEGKKLTSRGATENANDPTNLTANSSPGRESWLIRTPSNPHAAAWASYGSTNNVETPHGSPLPLTPQAHMGQFGNGLTSIAQMAQDHYGSPLTSTPQVPQGQSVLCQTAQCQISPINFGLPRGHANERHGFSHMNMDPFLLKSGVNDPIATHNDVLNDSCKISSPTTPMDTSQGLSSLDPSGPEKTGQNEVTPTNPILPNDYANTRSGLSSQIDLDGALLNDAMDFDSFDTDLDLSLLDWEAYYSKKYF
ncbi:hypothetical protein DL770_000720 [Monosporascus sp. CRB-9-2]|nr:hypothetical protein DL770_000720 [Monosporascus sp. CRB-9-2]